MEHLIGTNYVIDGAHASAVIFFNCIENH